MLEDVIFKENIIIFDKWVNINIVNLWNPFLNSIMIFITNIASPIVLGSLSVVLLGIFIYKKKKYLQYLFFSSMLSGLITELLIKGIIHRERPIENLIPFGASLFNYHYSFPSGHATMATIFFAALLYLFKDDIKNRVARTFFIISCVIIFLLVGFSRVYLNVHWASDVIAGFALGLFWLTFYILAWVVWHYYKK